MATLDPKPEPFKSGQKRISAEALNQIRAAVSRQLYGSGDTTVDFYGDRPVINTPKRVLVPGVENYVQQFVILAECDDYLICTQYTPIVNDSGVAVLAYNAANGNPAAVNILDSNTGAPTPVIGQQPGVVYIAKPYGLQRTPWDMSWVPTSGNDPSYYSGVSGYKYTGILLGQNGFPIPVGPNIGKSGPTYDWGNGIVLTTGIPNYGTRVGLYSNGNGNVPEWIQPAYVTGDLVVAVPATTGLYDPSGNPITWQDINTAARSWQPTGGPFQATVPFGAGVDYDGVPVIVNGQIQLITPVYIGGPDPYLGAYGYQPFLAQWGSNGLITIPYNGIYQFSWYIGFPPASDTYYNAMVGYGINGQFSPGQGIGWPYAGGTSIPESVAGNSSYGAGGGFYSSASTSVSAQAGQTLALYFVGYAGEDVIIDISITGGFSIVGPL
jgi:hypothetical protein